jgi:protein TonB
MRLFSRKERVFCLLWSFVAMVIGSGAVLVLVMTMNSFTKAPEKEQSGYREMEAAADRKPPKPPEKKKERPRKEHRSETPAAPAPALNTSVSGLSFGLPGLEQFGLGEAMDRMLAKESMSDVVMTAATVDEVPKPLQETRLEYPDRARKRNIEGYVVINMLIDTNGSVTQVRVLEADPPGVFDDITVAWARTLKFTPAYYKGRPVKTWARRRVPFKLS